MKKNQARVFKSIVTLYQNHMDSMVSDENPRYYSPYVEYTFARRGSLFMLALSDRNSGDDEGRGYELVGKNLTIYFDSIQEILATGWFVETASV